jgi:hypothetical protein
METVSPGLTGIPTTKGAAHRLITLLAMGGWTTSTLQAYRGGALADDLEQALQAPETELIQAEGEDDKTWQRRFYLHQRSFKAWRAEPYDMVLTDHQREVARTCLKKFASEGKMTLDQPAYHLLKALGFEKE